MIQIGLHLELELIPGMKTHYSSAIQSINDASFDFIMFHQGKTHGATMVCCCVATNQQCKVRL